MHKWSEKLVKDRKNAFTGFFLLSLADGVILKKQNRINEWSKSMEILLAACNAKYIHSNLAVYNLRAYAKKYQEHVILREYTINQQKDDIMRDIYQSGADVVCFSCYIWNISFVKEVMRDLAKIMP